MTSAITLPLADTWGMHGDLGAGWWVVMVIGMVVFWGAVILVGAWLLRGALDGRPNRPDESALAVLERRFAEGAVSVEDYRERRRLLDDRESSDSDRAAELDAQQQAAGVGATAPSGRSG